ncbi:YbaB/EbfC family nucleoid-associated protein [Nocardia wallacei]|uniref:YbaB/EbfC family nucleoid-associated protein n=1 Tax=Nocardia wallacei TaxID=480035 RepID=UPI0024566EB6|nr:YbaB/EbfC family nucleoid-associated protein [Nocardia wallacei]
MSEYPDLDASLQEIQAKAARVQAKLKEIRGTGTAANGTIIATVDAGGHLRDLKLPSNAARLGNQLASFILQATAAAEKDARKKAAQTTRPLTHDHRVEAGLRTIRQTLGSRQDQKSQPMTEEEIQAADDAYFERMNRSGWTNR